MSSGDIAVRAIGWVRSARTEPVDDDWDVVRTTVVLDEHQFGPSSVQGLEEFSHLDVVYHFHLVDPQTVQTGSRRPRGNAEWPEVGVFAQRAKARPNRLGVTTCRLLSVSGLTLAVEGLDAIDGTPVLDVKPHLREFAARGEVRQPRWAEELMRDYWSVRR